MKICIKYQIYGNVKSLKRHGCNEKNISIWKNNSGYLCVTLFKNSKGKNKLVHRLVAECFLNNTYDYPVVNHINGNKNDNSVNNLEWCTQKYNMQEAQKNGFLHPGDNLPKKRKINQFDLSGNFIKQWNSMIEIEKKLKYKVASICQCCKGKIKKSHNYIWEYAD